MRTLTAWLGRAISYVLFRAPAWLRWTLAYILAFLWVDLLRIRRRVLLDNIHIAFPNMSVGQRVRLARVSMRYWAMNFVEYSYLPWLNRDNYAEYVVFENSQLLEGALARGKGVLLFTLHMGHGDLACAALSLKGFPMVMVSKTFKLRWLNDLWFGMRERLGTRFVPARDSSFALLKALKSGSAVIIPLDQFTGPPIGVRTRFFGRVTGTAAGMAVMAGRSGAPVLPVYTYRNAEGRHVIRFEREIPVAQSRDTAVTAQVTQEFNDVLESIVRLHPEQWMWVHRRWKEFVVT